MMAPSALKGTMCSTAVFAWEGQHARLNSLLVANSTSVLPPAAWDGSLPPNDDSACGLRNRMRRMGSAGAGEYLIHSIKKQPHECSGFLWSSWGLLML